MSRDVVGVGVAMTGVCSFQKWALEDRGSHRKSLLNKTGLCSAIEDVEASWHLLRKWSRESEEGEQVHCRSLNLGRGWPPMRRILTRTFW